MDLACVSPINPFMPTGAFNICCPRDCVSRHNGGTSGAPLKPLRVDSAPSMRTMTLRGWNRNTWAVNWAEAIEKTLVIFQFESKSEAIEVFWLFLNYGCAGPPSQKRLSQDKRCVMC